MSIHIHPLLPAAFCRSLSLALRSLVIYRPPKLFEYLLSFRLRPLLSPRLQKKNVRIKRPPTTTAKRSETPKRHRGAGRPRTPVWRAYGLFSPVNTATPPLCVGGYRWLCIQRLVRYAPVAARNRAPSRNSNPALDLVNSHSILHFRNSHVILSKQIFYLFHAYVRKNNMWILDQPLSPQLPDLLLDLMFMRRKCVHVYY